MTPQTQKKIAAAGAIAVAVAVLSYISMAGIGKNIVYFWGVDELLAKSDIAQHASIRLGGFVKEGTYNWDEKTLDLSFDVAADDSGAGPTVRVEAKAAPPQMFREGIGVVVEGTFDGKIFAANRVIVKHSNEYQPPKEGERPEELYKTLMPDES